MPKLLWSVRGSRNPGSTQAAVSGLVSAEVAGHCVQPCAGYCRVNNAALFIIELEQEVGSCNCSQLIVRPSLGKAMLYVMHCGGGAVVAEWPRFGGW